MNKIAIAVSDFDNHICKLGPDHCAVCRAKAEFYRVSNAKWARLQEKWRLVRENASRRHIPNAMMVAAIMTDNESEEKCKA